MSTNPHLALAPRCVGAPLEQAAAVVLLVHGRGASADDMLGLVRWLADGHTAFIVPQAAGSSWYPQRFIAPLADNQPWLDWSLERIGQLVALAAAHGRPAARLVLVGFSQGACLALEYAARQPQRYGGVFGLSGALIEHGDTPRAYAGDLAGTPVLLSVSERDPHIPLARVQRSAECLAALGADVTTRVMPGGGHRIDAAELQLIRQRLAALSHDADAAG